MGKGSFVIFGVVPLSKVSSFGVKEIPNLAGSGSVTGVISFPVGSVR
jgi:hypothetical protein